MRRRSHQRDLRLDKCVVLGLFERTSLSSSPRSVIFKWSL